MKKSLRSFGVGLSSVAVLAVTSLVASGQVTYNGTITPGTLGGSVSTSLPQFNSALGTLTGVQVTLDFTVDPYATVLNFSGGPLVFDPGSDTSGSLSSANNLSITLGTDNWLVAEPTVSTGNIFGSNQVVPTFPAPGSELTFLGATTAPADLTSASGLDFSAYTGAGDLVFGVTGPVTFAGGGAWYNGGLGFGGAGADVSGTASVTYDYIAVPEPTTLALAGLGGLSLMLFPRRRK